MPGMRVLRTDGGMRVLYLPRWGPPELLWWLPWWEPGAIPAWVSDQRAVWAMLKKPASAAGPTGGVCASPEDLANWPTLTHYLSQTTWEDGEPRQTSTLMLFYDGPHVKMCLRDRENGKCAWMAGTSILDVLGVAEALLSDPVGPEWRLDRASGHTEAKRVKKGP